MASRRLLPAAECRIELKVVNSRFIASAAPVFTVEDARKFIQNRRAEFSDASHNVPAFIIGHGASFTEHCHDDGEPSGTAGRPMLAVLSGSGLGDVVVVVTRYFGGTKLGKEGLVRAYGDATKAVLSKISTAEKIATQTIMFGISYARFEQARELALAHNGQILDSDFGTDVLLTVCFKDEDYAIFQEGLTTLTNGAATVEMIDANPDSIFPSS